MEHASSKQKKAIAAFFFQSFYETKEKPNDSMVVYSEDYIEFLLRCLQIKLNLSIENRKYSMKEMVMLIQTDYKGLIRDRILTYYLLSPKIGVSNEDYEYCLKRSLDIMNSPVYKQYVENQLRKFSRGSLAYNFSLPDSDGRYVSLSDFKGKVVLMDFWFTGCSACISLSKDLVKKVIPDFKDSLVVFVSICLDKEKSKWIKSINSGLYTSGHSINLFTDGLGFAHPLIANYNIQGCPALLLIDGEGKVASARPQWDPEKLCAEIRFAIKNNSRPH
jgi:thiol-disulfide isomerase/thioredoxin